MIGFGLSILILFPGFGATLQSTICHPTPTPPSFTTPNATTTSSTYIINGTASPASSLSITDNTQPVGALTSDSSGNFGLQVSLAEGTNSFSVAASDTCGTTTSITPLILTRTVIITPTSPPSMTTPAVSASPAKLTLQAHSPPATSNITSIPNGSLETPTTPTITGSSFFLRLQTPPSGYKTERLSIFMKGTTAPDTLVKLSVNNWQVAQITAAPDGSFGVSVPLSSGSNKIVVRATFGSKTSSQTFTYIRTLSPISSPWYKHPLPLSMIALGVGLAGFGAFKLRQQERRS